MFKHILVPVDGSQGSQKALELAVEQARKFGAKVFVLFVVESPGRFFSPGYSYADLIESTRKWGNEVVAQVSEQLHRAGLKAFDAYVEDGLPAQVILQRAKDWEADLIVMGTHGRRGLDRLLLGSVAEEVVRCSPIPVLTVRLGNHKR